jgi:hypothetical protein
MAGFPSWSHDDDVLSTKCGFQRGGLVGVGAIDAPLPKGFGQTRIDGSRKVSKTSRPLGQVLPMGDATCQLRVLLDLVEHLFQTHERTRREAVMRFLPHPSLYRPAVRFCPACRWGSGK